MAIRAIETTYNGYRFRSRLEARWAVCFDHLEVEWHYEMEGFKLPSGWYLPDFYLPQVRMFAEVKPGVLSPGELQLCKELSDTIRETPSTPYSSQVLLLEGPPDMRGYFTIAALGEGWEEHFAEPYIFELHDIMEGHQYWKGEGRFFWAEEGGYPGEYGHGDYGDASAVNAARSARFERQ